MVTAMLALSACAVQKPYVITTKFDPAEVAWSTKPGTASIHGQAFMKTVGGDVKTCAGNEVDLIPFNSYVTEQQDAVHHGLTWGGFSYLDPARKVAWRTTRCNAQGDFVFSNIPAGHWLIETTATWGAVGQGWIGPEIQRQGGVLNQEATLSADEHKDMVLSR
jgi:hypothetical protein